MRNLPYRPQVHLGDTGPFAGGVAMDCYFHNAVPSVANCRDCSNPVCATCRDTTGLCPSCRLNQRIKAAATARPGLKGGIGPSNPAPPPPQPPQPAARTTALATVSLETRALLGLGYPLWPLAALAMLGPRRSVEVRRQAAQALGFNFGCFGMYFGLNALTHIPLLGISAWPLLAVLFPVWLVASVIYGIKVWNGDEVRVPLISEWLDEREQRKEPTRAA